MRISNFKGSDIPGKKGYQLIAGLVWRITRNSQSGFRRFHLISILLFLLLTAYPSFVCSDNSPVLRLLLEEKAPRVVVTGSSLMVEKLGKADWEPVLDRVRMAGFSPLQGGVELDGSDAGVSVYRIRSGSGMLRYAGRPQRGYLTIWPNGARLMVVSHMPLESYLAGVVNGEIDSSWPLEALKAQVVAARSYALYQLNTGSLYYDLKADINDQVYAGVDSEDERAVEAVALTRGQVLYRNGALFQAFFHSSCGGNTTSAMDVWGVPQPAQEGVYCGECDEAPFARWNLTLEPEHIVRTVRVLYPHVDRVRRLGIHRRSRDGRVQTLFVETGRGRILIDAGEFRKAMGYSRLPSTRFSLGISGEKIVLTGEGYGHGVGLCQWGARGSALRGMDYRQILRKYFPGTEIKKIY